MIQCKCNMERGIVSGEIVFTWTRHQMLWGVSSSSATEIKYTISQYYSCLGCLSRVLATTQTPLASTCCRTTIPLDSLLHGTYYQRNSELLQLLRRSSADYNIARGVARIFGLGGGRPCHVETDPESTEVAKPMRGVWVLPQKNVADLNAWNAFSRHLAPSP